MAENLAWEFPVIVAELPDDGEEFVLEPDEGIRSSLAKIADVLSVVSLTARLHVRPDGRGGAEVEGTLDATVRQNCVVTLEPFDNKIAERIWTRFVPPESLSPVTGDLVEIGEDDPPDPLIGGVVDLAAVVAEFLALSVDPYPRKPGAVFSPPRDAAAGKEASPFAALAKLKRGNGNEKG